jgi:hypothetical protein
LLGFWDNIEEFHKSVLKEHPTPGYESALGAVRYIRAVLEPNWVEQDSPRHPITSRIRVSYGPFNQWLDQFARKLNVMTEIEGTDSITKRLASLEQYSSARFEMEVGLALSLGGFEVRFIHASQSMPSADIMARKESGEFVVEVSTLNRSQKELRAMELSNWVASVSFTSGMTAGGMLNGIRYSPQLVTLAREEVSLAFERAKSSHSVQEVSVPGFARIWVAPRDAASQMPEGVAGMFSLSNTPEKDLQIRLESKIREKMSQISGEGLDSVLVIFSDVAGWQSLEDLFKKPANEIDVVINTIPSLMGLSLAGFGGLLRSPQSEQPQSKESMTLFMSEIGTQEPYPFLNWTNKYSIHSLPSGVFSAFQNYPTNLKSLPPFG